ncbi:NAD(P)/FAD-dependent oxidoreductase [Peribacillus muralis]|uniref:nitrite reductase large subunit NirB n=1 Tax=Peribacillus muralis TaxID=264697 RepID=UPI001F4E4436|nr:nitrite reductase large subunit NirB [Peribacillus muralis]MCK1993483.1 nitrite reductase large subunit NirB [Peribacillus muralis]MCK2014229.1 nitrite reductase large subunit NirB [Peribacillus muralis]
MNKQKLVLVGNGMAGLRCVESIIKNDPHAFEITIFGSEPHVNYNRILLSSVLQGKASFEDIAINERSWYTKHNILLYTGETVVKIDKEARKIKTDKEREVHYDKLIIATGSVPFILPVTGFDKQGVITFRTIEDCQKLIETARMYKKAVVIGGGLLGLEAARGLLNLGMEVKVVHISGHIMERQLDSTASLLLQKELENQGMDFLLRKKTQEIIGNERVERVRFKDGTELEADLVVMAAGVRPNIQLAKESGIDTNRAIVVNDHLETSIPNIYAVGECAEHQGIVYGLVKPLYEQGEVLAKHICERKCHGYQGSVLSTQLKISGVELFSVGDFLGDETTKSITAYDEIDGMYKKVVFQGKRIIGAVLYGDTKVSSRLLDLIINRQEVSSEERGVLFHSAQMSEGEMAAMDNHELICNCNAVSKGTIIDVVLNKGLTTVEQVKQCTKASSSCGGCKPVVTELLAYIQSNPTDETKIQKIMCSCTTLTEDEVVYQIQLQNLTSVQAVMDVLAWGNRTGCATCRPALSYYLGMIHPEYEIEQETLYINEQKNATVQSDERYSVIPQLYGGMTNAKDLRKIANVADKYDITQLAITSDQRIHLMGVKKEDLPGVWADLDMPLSSKYGNTVHNVKTCIGEHVCSCDKQQSLLLAVNLEKKFEHLLTPYRIKMGISACMHNGAGSTTKDIGVMGMDRGWEIYVGGSSGRNVRAGQLLCVASTNEDAIETIIGFIQYYRETANYLERTWQWIERVGLIHVREVLFDKELSQQLSQRFEMA